MSALSVPVGAGRPSRSVLTFAGYALVGTLAGLVLAAAGLVLGPVGPLAVVVVPAIAAVAWRRPDLVVVAVVLMLPVGDVALGSVELAQLGAALAAVAILVPAAIRLDWRLPPWPVAVPLGGFAVIAALATAGAADPPVAVRLDIQLVLLLLLTVAVTTALRTPDQVRLAVGALVVSGALTSLPAVFGAGPVESHYGGGVVTGRAEGVFAQPNELGLFSAVLLVAVIGVGLTVATGRLRLLCVAGGGLLLTALLLSLSRGAWIGTLVGLVALAVLVPAARRTLVRLGAAGLVVGTLLAVAGVGPFGEVLSRATSVTGPNPYDQRSLIWAEALRLYAESPLLGHGPGGFTVEAGSHALRAGAFLDVEHAHNLVLNVAVEFGTLGVLALLGLMAGLLTVVRRGRASGPLPGVLAAALVVVVAHGMVDYPLRNPVVLTTVWLVIALLVAAATATATPDVESEQV